MASISIKGLTKSFNAGDDAPAAVANLDLDIKDNQFVTLLGPSGCGKTTTLRMIAGYIVPDAGTIHINGRLLSVRGSVVPPDQRGMGMVFQNYAVWPHKTVYENVVFGLKVRKTPSAEAKKRVADALGREIGRVEDAAARRRAIVACHLGRPHFFDRRSSEWQKAGRVLCRSK